MHVEEPPVKVTSKADKRYRSTLTCDGTVPTDQVVELPDASYDIVFDGLKRFDREALKNAGQALNDGHRAGPGIVGRGSAANPKNRFEKIEVGRTPPPAASG